MQQQWTLMSGHESLGTLVSSGADMPWWLFDVAPTAVFEGVRPLFAAQLAAFKNIEGRHGVEQAEMAAWEEAHKAVEDLHLRVIGDDGRSFSTPLLHVEGRRAWCWYVQDLE